jgi:2-haloalkanoic acid dehalogenase type II
MDRSVAQAGGRTSNQAIVECVVFDIDGTLYDWETAIARTMERLLPEAPVAERERLQDRFRQALVERAFTIRDGVVVDRRYWLLLADPVPVWSAALPGASPGAASRLASRFRELLEPAVYSDAAPCLEKLRGRYRLGVLTNGPRADVTIAALGLASYFDAVVFPGDERRKPKREAFLTACEAMRVETHAVVYVGDSISHDVEGAIAAGLRAVWVDRHHDDYKLPANAFRVESLLELPAVLEEVSGRSATGA